MQVHVVQANDTLIIHGCFEDPEDANRYIEHSKDKMFITALDVVPKRR